MLGFWYFGSDRTPASVVASQNGPLEAVATPQLAPTPTRQELHRVQLKHEADALQAKLSEETTKLEARKKSLEQLYQKQQSLVGAGTYSSQIRSRELVIQDLIAELEEDRQAEENINNSAAVALRDQDSQAQVARDQVETGIQTLEQDIRDTQNELNYWQYYPVGLEALNQKSQIELLQDKLNQQKDQLNALRLQRINISASVLNNSQSVESLAEMAREELRSSAEDVQTRVSTLRSEMDRLQGAQNQVQGDLQKLQFEASKGEKDLEEQAQQVQSLQSLLKAKESEMREE